MAKRKNKKQDKHEDEKSLKEQSEVLINERYHKMYPQFSASEESQASKTYQDLIDKMKREAENFQFLGAPTVVDFLKEKYDDVVEAQVESAEAGTRRCFRARDGERRLFIKVDKVEDEIESAKAKRHMERELNTEHETEISKKIPIDEAILNHISPSVDSFEVGDAVVSVEVDFESSTSLKRRVADGKLLNLEEFKQVFSDVLTAEKCLIGREILHRDLGPGNILVRKNCKGLEARITDLANACKKSEVKELCPEREPSLGAGVIADPLAFSKQIKYDESSEVYAIASDMVFALTGKPVADYDYVRNNKVDVDAHNAAVRDAIRRLPKESRRFSGMLQRALSLDLNKRYKSLDEFAKAFEKSGGPTLFEKVKRGVKGAVAAGLILGGLIAGSDCARKTVLIPAGIVRPSPSLEQRAEQKYLDVQPEYNGSTMRIENNLFSSDFEVRDEKYQMIYGANFDGKISKKVPLHFRAGEKIRLSPTLKPVPLPSGVVDTRWYRFDGRFYIEGFDETSKEFSAVPDVDSTKCSDGFWGVCNPDVDIVIPEDMPEGTFFLVMDIHSRENAKERNIVKNTGSSNMEGTHLRFPEGTVINRSRVPIVIGNPKESICPIAAQVGWGGNLNVVFGNPADHLAKIARDIIYEAKMRSENGDVPLKLSVNSASNCSDLNIWLPHYLPEGEQSVVRITARDSQKKEIGRYEVPVRCFSAGLNRETRKPYSFYEIPSKVKRNYQTGRRK